MYAFDSSKSYSRTTRLRKIHRNFYNQLNVLTLIRENERKFSQSMIFMTILREKFVKTGKIYSQFSVTFHDFKFKKPMVERFVLCIIYIDEFSVSFDNEDQQANKI